MKQSAISKLGISKSIWGHSLREARVTRGISLTDMAVRVGCSKGNLSAIERGANWPTLEIVAAYERELALEPHSLQERLLASSPNSSTDPTLSENKTLAKNHNGISQPVDEIMSRLKGYRLLVYQGEYELALKKLAELQTVTLTPAQTLLADFVKSLALVRTGQTAPAREILRSLETRLKSQPQFVEGLSLPQIYYQLAASYQLDQQLETAIYWYETTLGALGDEAASASDLLGFYTYGELGRLWSQVGDLTRAEMYYDKARNHPKAREDERAWAKTLLTEGLKLVEQHHYPEALIKLEESERLYEKLQVTEQAGAVASFRNVLLAQQNKAVETDTVAINQALNSHSTSPTTKLIILTNQVAVTRLANKLEEALQNLQVALEFLNKHRQDIDKLTVAHVYHEAARLKIAGHFEKEAIKAFDQALAVLREIKAPWAEFNRIYEDYTQVLLNWGRDAEYVQLGRQRLLDKNQAQGGSSLDNM